MPYFSNISGRFGTKRYNCCVHEFVQVTFKNLYFVVRFNDNCRELNLFCFCYLICVFVVYQEKSVFQENLSEILVMP